MNCAVDETRVELNSGVTDYINASHVNVCISATITTQSNLTHFVIPQGYKQCNAFLATQSPMEDTVADFWQMVWDAQSKVIVMLCKIEEEGKVCLI